jgi:hypothetical protein
MSSPPFHPRARTAAKPGQQGESAGKMSRVATLQSAVHEKDHIRGVRGSSHDPQTRQDIAGCALGAGTGVGAGDRLVAAALSV